MTIAVDHFAQALGGFAWNYSLIEYAVQSTLWKLAGVKEPLAQAIFTGIRVDGASQMISRIADAQEWPQAKRKEAKYIFDQLSLINKLRNDVLHYGAYRLGSDYIISNRRWVHTPPRIRELRITPATLEAASEDIGQILTRLHFLDGSAKNFPPEISDGMKSVLKASWRFKPPPLAWPKDNTKNGPRKKLPN